jgi:D-alanine-D-alanine ligase
VADIGPDDLSALDAPADVIFPALHGTFGEDGALQEILETRGVPFVGSGAAASRLAMDKVASKERVSALGFDTPEAVVLTRSQLDDTDFTRGFPLPAVVKPADQGSSVATFMIRDLASVESAVRMVLDKFERVLVERYITGEELTVGILAGKALPPICVRPKQKFYDYCAKYEDAGTEYLFEPGLSAEVMHRVAAQSERVFAEFDCRHLGRVDWMCDGEGRLWFLEVNTIPGFTSHSLVPKAACRTGLSFEELCQQLILLALER